MLDTVNEIKHIVKPSKRRPYLQAKVQGSVDTRTLYDTGADISCLNEEMFEKIPQTERESMESLPIGANEKFWAASGDELKVRGRYNVQVHIEGRNVTYPFFVIRGLNEEMLLGIDFISDLVLQYDVKTRSYYWGDAAHWVRGKARVSSVQTLDPLSVTMCKVSVRTDNDQRPSEREEFMVNIQHQESPLICGGPYLARVDENGHISVPVYNCAPTPVELKRNDFIGVVENITKCEKREINPRYLSAVAAKREAETTLSKEKRQFILDNLTLNVPEELKESYLKVILDNHECISCHRFDLGRTNTLFMRFRSKQKSQSM